MAKIMFQLLMTKNNIGIVLRNLGRYEESLKWYQESLEISKKHYGKNHVLVAIRKNNIG